MYFSKRPYDLVYKVDYSSWVAYDPPVALGATTSAGMNTLVVRAWANNAALPIFKKKYYPDKSLNSSLCLSLSLQPTVGHESRKMV